MLPLNLLVKPPLDPYVDVNKNNFYRYLKFAFGCMKQAFEHGENEKMRVIAADIMQNSAKCNDFEILRLIGKVRIYECFYCKEIERALKCIENIVRFHFFDSLERRSNAVRRLGSCIKMLPGYWPPL